MLGKYEIEHWAEIVLSLSIFSSVVSNNVAERSFNLSLNKCEELFLSVMKVHRQRVLRNKEKSFSFSQ